MNIVRTERELINLGFPDKAAEIDVSAVDYEPTVVFTIYVGTGGDLKYVPAGQTAAVTIKNVPDAFYVVGAMAKIVSTGTTATDIVAMWTNTDLTVAGYIE